ncbi:hypothetical protein [Streptomyces sp. NBC_00474]|uniref:hypothetical protein n=1 Tax=Streptomyces sp. NBC_00474 TaxID=2975754 RepID=UPI00225A149F|nr:hypothetical protein [Streptomyces sp. NBC_00474]MCX5055097.1 hypothetical protein [Streptomyces sp. NBC_00474]
MPRDALISHRYFGPTPNANYLTSGLSQDEAHRLIGANTLAGFEPVLYTRTPVGDHLRTRDGNLLTVVALHGSSLRGVIEIEQV